MLFRSNILMDCSICYEKTENILSCNHSTCICCLKKLIKRNNCCPVCRKEFDILPYKYIPPRHSPNLKISVKMKKFLNKFLSCRYFLKQNKHQKFYAILQCAYHEYIFVDGKFINPSIISKLSKYDCLQYYIYFYDKKCIFPHHIKKEMMNALENYICSPDITNYVNSLYSFL